MRLNIAFILLSLLLGCASENAGNFPDHWWKSVERQKLKWWEISPDAAKKGEVVLSKRNELGLLSNFAATPFQFRGKKYESVEGLWQSMKYPEGIRDPRHNIRDFQWNLKRADVEKMVGHKAKKAGGQGSKAMNLLKIDWVSFEGKRMTYRTSDKGEHYNIIRQAMVEKLKQNPKVKEILLATGDLKLLPDHNVKKGSPPAWRYYDIWMEIRDLVKAGKL